MEQEQSMTSLQNTTPAPEQNVMAQGVSAKKGGKGMMIGMALLAILAIGGISFGIFTMMDGNAQKDSLNKQISELKSQNSVLSDKIAELEETIKNYENNTAGGADEGVITIELSGFGEVEVGIAEGVFSIKDSEGEILVQSNTAFTKITSCNYTEEDSTLKCVVTDENGEEGWFLYSAAEGILTSNLDEMTEVE